jgi:hypothetical protein
MLPRPKRTPLTIEKPPGIPLTTERPQPTAGVAQPAAPAPQAQPPLEQVPEFQEPLIETGEQLRAFEQAEAGARSDLEAALADIATNVQRQTAGREQEFGRREAFQLGEQERGRKETRGLISQARQTAAEIQQGLRARFGGAQIGGFAAGLASREAVKQIAQFQSRLQQAVRESMQQIEFSRQEKNTQIQNVMAQGETLKRQAQQELRQTLLSIQTQRGRLESEKNEIRRQAVADFNNVVSQINARNRSFEQQIFVNDRAAQQQLAKIQSRANKALTLDVQGIEEQTGLSIAELTQTAGGAQRGIFRAPDEDDKEPTPLSAQFFEEQAEG